MALFVLIFLVINNCLTSLLGSENSNNGALEIKSSAITPGQTAAYYKVDDTLNLTCIFRNDSILPDVILDWVVPTKTSNSQNRVIYEPGTNFIVLIIKNLQENDSGEYKCRAVHNGIPFFNTEDSIKIHVKTRKKECTDVMFQCSPVVCISKRYTCDGYKDCPNGEDESSTYCGPGNPCDNKLMCPDDRCIPFTWCCEYQRETNCTAKGKLSCCLHVEKLTRDLDSDLGYKYRQQRFSDMGFLQTTVYTVIGCAMAFMFIVTIIVIAICRVHVRRSLLSRCSAPNRNLRLGCGGNIHGNHLNGLSLYDLDLYFNRPGGLNGNDLMSINPLLVTYNINNGVQFVGRPIDPPPYCEIVTSPPKEGPPPPYASHENLLTGESDKIEEPLQDVEELTEVCVDAEVTELDALLGATSHNISVISCNDIDVMGCSEDILKVKKSEQENNKVSIIDNESTSKESPNTGVSSNSSQCTNDVVKGVEESKNSGLDILVLNNCDVVPENTETLKLQSGESSSFVQSNVSDLSKGAVRKITSTTKSLDSSKSNSKTISKNQIKKY